MINNLNEAIRHIKAAQLMLLGKDNQPISDLYYALQMALDLIEESEWISVKERLPDDFCVVLVYCPQFDNIYRVFRESDAWHQFSTSDILMQAVTHWRPLPKAPESEDK